MTDNDFQQLLNQSETVPPSEIANHMDRMIASHHDSLDHCQQVDLLYFEYLTRRSAGDSGVVNDLRQRYPHLESEILRQVKVDTELSRWDETTDTTPTTKSPDPERDHSQNSIGDYTVLEKIGEGAQAEVFRVVHPMLRCELALKVSKHRTKTADRVLDEGRLLATVNDPAIARVIDAGIWDGRQFIVSELIRGITLKKRVEQDSLTRQQLVEFVAGLSRTVGNLHNQGIVHCDIKPTNVLFDVGGQPRLVDFGMAVDYSTEAWDADSILRDTHSGGTLAYMAPELLSDARQKAERTDDVEPSRSPAGDIFSLGGLLYFGLVARHPYASRDSKEIVDAVSTGRWDRQALLDSGAPQALQKACERAMAKRPEERWQSATLFADSLDDWLIRSRNGKRRRGVLIAIPLFALLGACWLAWPHGQLQRQAAQPFAAGSIERFGNLDVKVWAEDRAFELVNRVPVLTGEQIQINAPLRAGHHGELWLLNSDGEAARLAEFSPADKSRWVHFPTDLSEAVPLVGPTGTEAIVWLESQSAMTQQETERGLGKPDRWPTLGESTVFRLIDGELRVEQYDRGFGEPVQMESADSVVQKHLRAAAIALQSQGKHVEILAFSHIE